MIRRDFEPFLSRREWWMDDELEAVGFFDDGLNREDLNLRLNDKRWVTPTNHLGPKGVVLCMTGAFSPFHAGHLRALEIAKETVEASGRVVAGALIQPDHDAYVSAKRGGAAKCDASTRIHLAQEVTKHVPWIAVDPWPSLYQDRALNYTTILRRTERYLGPGYQVVYVFGSDNAGFADAFLPHEYVCVARPGYGTLQPSQYSIAISSTDVRSATKPVYPYPTVKKPYLVRDDIYWATQGWGALRNVRAEFVNDLMSVFKEVVGWYPALLDPSVQKQRLDVLKRPHVSFDRVTGATHWVSRVFNPCTHQHEPARWLSSDLSLIPPGNYALIDDDIASGATVDYIRSQTPQVNWIEMISMTQWSRKGDWFDIVDARDFLFGARMGGLCIAMGGEVVRAPYITPWVNLMQRAKIPPHKQPAFVQAIIRANVRFFSRAPITVAQTENRAFWARLGYGLDTPMLVVCNDLLTWNPNA